MKDMHNQLTTWRTTLQHELSSLEQKAAALATEIAEARGKIGAINRLLGETNPQATLDLSASAEATDGDVFTPLNAYFKPILQTLVEFGGRGRRMKVIDSVGRRMKPVLTQSDYGKISSGAVRWENRAAWAAKALRSNGLIKSKEDSPRGIWEITDAGRQWLAKN